MISIFTGLPRSGKSYRAVWYIQKNFIDPKSLDFPKHKYLYCNIGGFKHDLVNEQLQKNPLIMDDKLKEKYPLILDDMLVKESIYLDWEWFYKHLTKLHEMAMVDKPDEELQTYARYHKLTPAFFVIDEAYRYYTKKVDPVLKWWHGYHGHLGHDILIIIHLPTLMSSDYYKPYVEDYIDAQPKSKSLSDKSFRYKFFSSDLYKTTPFHHVDKISVDQNIFELYKSGDMHKPKKILHKFIGYIAGGALLIAIMIYLLFSRLAPDPVENENLQSNQFASIDENITVEKSPISSSMLLRVRCDAIACSRVDNAYVTNYIPRLYFEEALKMIDSKLLAGSTVRVFDVEYNDRLFSIPSDDIRYFSMWNVPLLQTQKSKSTFGSSSDVYKSAGITQ